eukprot:scaffold327672_cov36-Prasinocladus_malaysianus.AAC.1
MRIRCLQRIVLAIYPYLTLLSYASEIKAIIEHEVLSLAWLVPNQQGRTPCGTGPYMAPEVVKHHKYGLAIDMWSLGCVLHVMLTGERAFDGKVWTCPLL